MIIESSIRMADKMASSMFTFLIKEDKRMDQYTFTLLFQDYRYEITKEGSEILTDGAHRKTWEDVLDRFKEDWTIGMIKREGK